jgi:hypothetical protein
MDTAGSRSRSFNSAAIAMFLAPATGNEVANSPQRDGVYLAAIN